MTQQKDNNKDNNKTQQQMDNTKTPTTPKKKKSAKVEELQIAPDVTASAATEDTAKLDEPPKQGTDIFKEFLYPTGAVIQIPIDNMSQLMHGLNAHKQDAFMAYLNNVATTIEVIEKGGKNSEARPATMVELPASLMSWLPKYIAGVAYSTEETRYEIIAQPDNSGVKPSDPIRFQTEEGLYLLTVLTKFEEVHTLNINAGKAFPADKAGASDKEVSLQVKKKVSKKTEASSSK